MGGPLPLQISEIVSYAKIHGFMADLKFFYRCMVAMDVEYFKHLAETKKAEKPAAKSAPRGPRPPRRRR